MVDCIFPACTATGRLARTRRNRAQDRCLRDGTVDCICAIRHVYLDTFDNSARPDEYPTGSARGHGGYSADHWNCLLYTSDAADERSSVDLGGRRIIKKKKNRLE